MLAALGVPPEQRVARDRRRPGPQAFNAGIAGSFEDQMGRILLAPSPRPPRSHVAPWIWGAALAWGFFLGLFQIARKGA